MNPPTTRARSGARSFVSRFLFSTALAGWAVAAAPLRAQTLPVPVTNGGATITTTGSQMSVDLNDHNRIIPWASFNVGADKTVNFTTATTTTPFAVLNRVVLPNPSQILGSITSQPNVTVWLVNPSGITFGSTGSFSGGSLVLSTAAMNDPIADANFLNGSGSITLPGNGGGSQGIVLTAGSGALQAAGPILLVAQTISAGKTITSTGGDVALVAASDVVVPNAYGSPLGIAITKGTAMATAQVDVTGAIRGNSVRLYGASQDDLTAALLNVESGASLTATQVGGKVILSAGKADGTDMTFGDGGTDGLAPIALAGSLAFTQPGASSVTIASNAGVTGGGSIGSAANAVASVTLDTPNASDVVLGDIFSKSDVTIARAANLTLGAVTVGDGHIDLSTTGGFAITTGALNVTNASGEGRGYVHVDSSGLASIASASAQSVAVTPTADNVSIVAAGPITYGGGSSAANMIVRSASDAVTINGGITAATDVTVTAGGGTATIAGTVNALGGSYTVSGGSVSLGSAGTSPVTQQAANAVSVTATARGGTISGVGALTLQSNANGVADGTDTRALSVIAPGNVTFAAGSNLLGGTAGQSLAKVSSGGAISLGSLNARALVSANDATNTTLNTAGNFIAGSVTTVANLSVKAGGAIKVGNVRSSAGWIDLKATGLTTVSGDVDAATTYSVGGSSVILGDGTARTQSAVGLVSITANAGSITGKSGVTVQSNRNGADDGANTAYLSLQAKGGAVDFSASSQVLGGNALQSLVAINSATGVAANDPTSVALGTVKARGLVSAADLTSGLAAPTFTLVNLLTVDPVSLTATAGAIRFGAIESRNGSVTLTTTATAIGAGDISGLFANSLSPTPTFASYGRGTVTARTAITVNAAGGIRLGAVSGGDLVTLRSGAAGGGDGVIDATSVASSGGSFDVEAYAASPATAPYTGGVTLGSATAALDGTIAGSGAVAIGGRGVATAVGRNLTVRAGTAGVSTDSAVTITGNLSAGSPAQGGNLGITGSRVSLVGGTKQATGGIDIRAYGTGAGDGIVGSNGVTVIANANDATSANPLTLRADGGAGIAFSADSMLLGGGIGQSADIGIFGTPAKLTLGTVTARSVQGVSGSPAAFGSLANPNPVLVAGDVQLAGAVTTLGKLDLRSSNGAIDTQAITTGAAGANDRGLSLSALGAGGTISAHGALLAYGDVTLAANGAIRLTSVTATPSTTVPGDAGAITITTTAGDVTGFADTLSATAPFAIGRLTGGTSGVSLTGLPDNASIDSITSGGNIALSGQNIRLGSAITSTGAIAITAGGALTGTSGAFGGVGPVSANLFAQSATGSITVTAGGAGNRQTVSLNKAIATNAVRITADRIAINTATSTSGLLNLAAGSGLALGSGAGDMIVVSGTGAATVASGAPDFTNGVLDSAFGRTALTAQGNSGTISVTAATIAQLGVVSAGATPSAGSADQIHIDAGALSVTSLVANNGNVYASATRAVAGIGSPLYVGAIASGNGVTLVKALGSAASASDEARIGTITAGLAGTGAVTIRSDTNLRVGPVAVTGGGVSAQALGDVTGLALTTPAGTPAPPQPSYGLVKATADGAIALNAGHDAQVQALTGGDVDITAGNVAWIGGNVAANGHYRVTGGSVVLGAPGNAIQSATGDVTIRSTLGGISGGSGLRLQSASAGSTAASSYLVLDSAADITFADGLHNDTASLLLAGASVGSTSAGIGIRLAAGAALQLGSVRARSIGSVGAAGAGAPTYTVSPTLTVAGNVSLRDIVVGNDLLIDTFDATRLYTLTLDSARSLSGGIQLSTASTLRGHEITPGNFTRTNLTAADAIEVESASSLLGTLDAGTGLQVLANGGSLDLSSAVARAGDIALRASGDLRVDRVSASGNGNAATSTMLLANPATAPLRHLSHAALSTAGRIDALSVNGDITDTTLGGNAAFATNGGGIALTTTADLAGKGLITANTISTTGAGDIALQARRVAIGTLMQSNAGSITIAANQLGSAQNEISVIAPRLSAAGAVSVTTGVGTGAIPSANNGAIRVGAINGGSIALTASGGNITGLLTTGATGGALSDYARANLTTSGTGTITASAGMGTLRLGTVTAGAPGTNSASDQITGTARAIDIASATANSGNLTLNATAADIVLGTGSARGNATLTAAGNATIASLTTQGALAVTTRAGTVSLDSGTAQGNLTIDAANGATLGTLATNAALNVQSRAGMVTLGTGSALGNATVSAATSARIGTLQTRSGGIAVTATNGDVTGLLTPGAAGTALTDYGRSTLTAGGTGTITANAAAGTLRLGTLTAGTIGTKAIGDQIVASAKTIDITSATANTGNLALTSTGSDVTLGTGFAQGNATIVAANNAALGALTANAGLGVTTRTGMVTLTTGNAGTGAAVSAATSARIGSLQTAAGRIAVTAANGDVTGLAGASTDYGRANLTVGGSGSITVTAAAGSARLGTLTAGTLGGVRSGDQIVVSAQAVDVATATANTGNLSLTSTSSDVTLGSGSAQGNATIVAANDASLGSIAAKGALGVSTQAGSVTLGTGAAGTNAIIATANGARIGSLQTNTGNISVTATNGDVSGLLNTGAAGSTLTDYGRANLTSGGTGTITVNAAAGNARLGTVTAGAVGVGGNGDRIIVSARAVDVTAATANTGNLVLTATGSDVTLGSGSAQGNATIVAANNASLGSIAANGALGVTTRAGSVTLATGAVGTNAIIAAANGARIGTLQTNTGNIAVTATNGDVTGLLDTGATGAALTDYGRANLTSGGSGTIAVNAAAGTARLGAVTAGVVGSAGGGDQIVVSAGTVDITTATANSGNLNLRATASDLTLGTGSAAGGATLVAAHNLGVGKVTAGVTINLTAQGGFVKLGAGTAQIDATVTAAGSARVGSLQTTSGNIAITASGGDVTGLLNANATGSTPGDYGRANLTTGGTGTITANAAGTLRLDTVSAGTAGLPGSGDQIVGQAGTIDILALTAASGNLRLTSTAGGVLIGSGAAQRDATIVAATDATIGNLTATSGALSIATKAGVVTLGTGKAGGDAILQSARDVRLGSLSAAGNVTVVAANGDITGLLDPTSGAGGYGRADLTTGAAGTITATALAGNLRLGAVTAGTSGTAIGGDQIIGTAQAIDIVGATAGAGNLNLISTAGDISLQTGSARGGGTISAANAATIGTLDAGTALNVTARNGAITLGSGGAQADATILAATGVTIGSLTATTGALSVTAQAGDITLGSGMAGTSATIVAANNARIGSVQTGTGNLSVAATTGDVTGLLTPGAAGGTAGDYGRADLTTGGAGMIVANAAGTLRLGTVNAGTLGAGSGGDRIVATAAAIDIASAAANIGNLNLTSTAADIVLGTSFAQGSATLQAANALTVGTLSAGGAASLTARAASITLSAATAGSDATLIAATSARIGTVQTGTGNIAVTTNGGDISGLAGVGATGGALVGYGRANFTSGGNGAISMSAANGTVQLGSVIAGGQFTSNARAIDIASATAGGALSLASTAGDVTLGSGTAQGDLSIVAANTATLGTLHSDAMLAVIAQNGGVRLDTATAQGNATILAATDATVGSVATAGGLSLTTRTGDVTLGMGTAGTGASLLAANSARIGTLGSAGGIVSVTATGGDVTGLPLTGAPGGYDRANISTGGSGAIVANAGAGVLRLGTVTAGAPGTSFAGDQLTGTARAIDVTTATTNGGNLKLTATAGDVTLASGSAQGDLTILAANNISLGTLTTNGALDVTARTGGVALGGGTARSNATILSANDAAIGSLTTTGGALSLTSQGGAISIGAGNAGTTATVLAATNARIGTLQTVSNATVTANRGDISGLLNAGAAGTSLADYGAANLKAGGAIALTTDLGTAKLGTVATSNQAIALTAADAMLTGVIDAGTSRITLLRGSASNRTLLGSVAQPAGGGALNLDAGEIANLHAATVQIGSRLAQAATADDITIGALALNAATGSTALQLLGTGVIRLTGAVTDAGAPVARTVQIGGDDTALPLDQGLTNQALAGEIRATLVPGNQGALIDLGSAAVDLRAQRITFGSAAFLARIDSETGGLAADAAGRAVADNDVSRVGSPLYNGFPVSGGPTTDVFLRANTLQVAYRGYALFQNTGTPSLGKGVVLGAANAGSSTQTALVLRSTGDTPTNAFALFGTVNGFGGRTAGVLPNEVLNFLAPGTGSRFSRVTQANSRVNGCVIGSPDRGCLATDTPPPQLKLFDETQLQIFGVTDDLTIPIEQTVGTSNEALIGDFTTTGGLIKPECPTPDNPDCPVPGVKP